MKAPAGKRRLARWSKKAASGIKPATGTTRQPVKAESLSDRIREIGNDLAGKIEPGLGFEERRAGAPRQQPGLALEQAPPAVMLLRRMDGQS